MIVMSAWSHAALACSFWTVKGEQLEAYHADQARSDGGKGLTVRRLVQPVKPHLLSPGTVGASQVADRWAVPYFNEYCNSPVSEGTEGLPSRMGMELRAVVLTIRHGDRSPLKAVPEALPSSGRFSCAAGDLETTWSELPRRFQIVAATTGAPFDRKISPKLRPGGADEECDLGQLTARGFRQHLWLGSHLAKAYRGLLEALANGGGAGGALYIRSTDYRRTQASAAALLTKMLPWPLWNESALPIAIAVHENGGEEVMQPKSVQKRCPASARLDMAQKALWRNPEAEFLRIRDLLGEEAYQMSLNDLVDKLSVAACHGLPPLRGSGGCIESALSGALAKSADQFSCARYAGAGGGGAAARLAMQPFLAEVLLRLQRAVEAPGPELALFSGHDTVIAPMLSALGVYRGRFCGRPPYASRIALELYRTLPETADAGAYYVRVVYNGQMLSGVRGCDATAELCPLENFTYGIRSLLAGAPNFAAACQ